MLRTAGRLTICSSNSEEEEADVSKADMIISMPCLVLSSTFSMALLWEKAISAFASRADDRRTEIMCTKLLASSRPRYKVSAESLTCGQFVKVHLITACLTYLCSTP